MLKIYGAKTFNAVKAVLTAEEAGVDYEYVAMDFSSGEHKSPEYMKIHPLGKIPAMEHNGQPIFESNNMCRYIANISDSKLYSKDALEAANIDQMVDFIGYHAGRWITTYFFQEIIKKAFQDADPDPEEIAEAAGFLEKQLPYLDGLLAESDFLCGDHVTIADCVAFPMIMAQEYTSFSIENYANICRWYDQMKARPSYGAMMEHFPDGYKF
jgi:glutathione S-transferase|tara:strand:- start:119132 stop:119767 length:636 start_codon:yes stop_codon:yes gene_type:complete